MKIIAFGFWIETEYEKRFKIYDNYDVACINREEFRRTALHEVSHVQEIEVEVQE